MLFPVAVLVALLVAPCGTRPAHATTPPNNSWEPGRAQSPETKPFLPVGLFFGQIEEGARIFTPVRFLPFEHPEALGHDFPTVLQSYGSEYEALLWLGDQAGLRLRATLQRYPREPSPTWPYSEFHPPPDTTDLRGIPVSHRPHNEALLPGLRAVLYQDGEPILFIVDTRGLSLEARGMRLPTTMGLDLNRSEFLDTLERGASLEPANGLVAIVFDPK